MGCTSLALKTCVLSLMGVFVTMATYLLIPPCSQRCANEKKINKEVVKKGGGEKKKSKIGVPCRWM